MTRKFFAEFIFCAYEIGSAELILEILIFPSH